MRVIEKMARDICAKGGTSFCQCVGMSQGCKTGCGQSPIWQNCQADTAQLQLSGALTLAESQYAIASSEPIEETEHERRLRELSEPPYGTKVTISQEPLDYWRTPSK